MPDERAPERRRIEDRPALQTISQPTREAWRQVVPWPLPVELMIRREEVAAQALMIFTAPMVEGILQELARGVDLDELLSGEFEVRLLLKIQPKGTAAAERAAKERR